MLGLAEMMNYPGIINGDPEVLAKIRLFKDKIHRRARAGPVGA